MEKKLGGGRRGVERGSIGGSLLVGRGRGGSKGFLFLVKREASIKLRRRRFVRDARSFVTGISVRG